MVSAVLPGAAVFSVGRTSGHQYGWVNGTKTRLLLRCQDGQHRKSDEHLVVQSKEYSRHVGGRFSTLYQQPLAQETGPQRSSQELQREDLLQSWLAPVNVGLGLDWDDFGLQ